jgi:hypothetical protein
VYSVRGMCLVWHLARLVPFGPCFLCAVGRDGLVGVAGPCPIHSKSGL